MSLMLEQRLLKRKELGNLRCLKLPQPLIDFSSNDYLGLARSPLLAHTFFKEWEKERSPLNGLGSTGSRLLTGNSRYFQDLEERIAQFHGYPAGTLFNCGYMANVGLISTIANPQSVILYDAAVHASTHDGIRLSRAKALPFRHNDLEHLASRLKTCALPESSFICIESIYSTDGSLAPLVEICQLANAYGAHLIVDEAHAIGIYGPEGRGLVAEHHLTDQIFAQVATFGKALGTYGAIVLGSSLLKQALINFATSYIYTTALPFQALAAIKSSYALFPQMDLERHQLQTLIQLLRAAFNTPSTTHIQPLHISGNAAAKQASQQLMTQGFDLKPLLSPSVKRGEELLRICLHAFNTESEMRHLIQSLQPYRGI